MPEIIHHPAYAVNPALSVLLVDGSALYFGQRAFSPDRNMDYEEFLRILQLTKAYPSTKFNHALYFTASDQTNEKQAKFHEHISQIGFKVFDVPPHEAFVNNPLLGEQNARLIRFDSIISYMLARFAGSTTQGLEACIVTDSYPVSLAVRDAARRSTMIKIAFFGSSIDTRWHRIFRESGPDGRIRFIDLEQSSQWLFNRPRPNQRKDDYMLDDLP